MTHEQNIDLQIDALHQAGCERIFEGKDSGAKTERPKLQAALAYLREGDVFAPLLRYKPVFLLGMVA